MTQIRKFEFRDDDKTVDINAQLMGIVESGVYRGFDAQLEAGLVLKLVHTASGGTFVNDTPAVVENIGILRTKQGTVIREDALVEITIGSNDTGEGPPLPRIDLIVCEHWHQDIVGGVQAQYYAIPGGQAEPPVAPALTDPAKQMIIGELYLPGGAVSLDEDGVKFTKAPLPTNPSLPDIVYPASYDPDTKTISTAYKNHSLYYIIDIGVASDYPEVENIDLFTINYLSATLISGQKYALKTGPGNLYFNSMNDFMIVEGYEEIQVFATAEFFGGAVGACMVITTGRVYKNSVNKLYAALIGNIGTDGVLTSGELTLMENGNIQKISVTGNADLKSINTFAQPNTLPGYNSGMQLIIQITTTDRITLKHLAPGISAPYKNIYVYGKKDVMLSGNISLYLYEDENYYVLFQWNADTVISAGSGASTLRNGVFCGTGSTEIAEAFKSMGISELYPSNLLFVNEISAGISESGQWRYTVKIWNAQTVDSDDQDSEPWLQWTALVASKKTGYELLILQEEDGSGVGGALVIDWSKLSLPQYQITTYKAGALYGISVYTNWGGPQTDLVEIPLVTITGNVTIDGSSKLYVVEAATNLAIMLDSIKICRSTFSIKNNMIADYTCRVECLDGENINQVLAITIPAFTTVTLFKNVTKWEATGSYVDEPLP